MKSFPILGFLFVFFNLTFWAQTDSLMNDAGFKIKEGIYLNYESFRKNNPIAKDQIESDLDKDHLDYFGKILSAEKFTFTAAGGKINQDSKSVWGFYQNNILHLKYDKNFYRVPLFGSICYLVAVVDVMSPAYYSPGYGGMMGGTVKTKETRDFLMNFYDGKLIPFSMNEAEKLLERDATLYAEYKSLRSRQRKEQVSRYIRKYNELHPVYFLK